MTANMWAEIFVTLVTCGGVVLFCRWFSVKILRVMRETVDECVKATQEQAYRTGLGDGFEMYERWRQFQDIDPAAWDPALLKRIADHRKNRN